MNLLPTKSWNVWNAENRQKVLRDEQEHKEKEEAENKRQQLVQSEKRLELLRERARARYGQISNAKTPESKSIIDEEQVPTQHFTLFDDFADDSLALSDSKRKQHIKQVCKPIDEDETTMKKKKKRSEDVAPQGVRFGQLPEYRSKSSVPRYHKIVNSAALDQDIKSDNKRKREQEPPERKKKKKKKSLEELRQERLEREEKERKRMAQLLQKKL
jgi:hypothetical protein